MESKISLSQSIQDALNTIDIKIPTVSVLATDDCVNYSCYCDNNVCDNYSSGCGCEGDDICTCDTDSGCACDTDSCPLDGTATETYLVLSGDSADGGTISWKIYDLTNEFNTTSYKCAGIALSEADGTTKEPSDTLDTTSATSSGSNTYAKGKVTDVGYGDFYIYGFAQASNGKYYPAGEDSVYIEPATVEYWSWSTSMQTAIDNNGYVSKLKATEWNDFLDRINQMKVAKNQASYTVSTSVQTSSNTVRAGEDVTFTELLQLAEADSGDTITAQQFNTARLVIGGVVSTGISVQYSGDEIKGSYFNTLAEKLNDAIDTI